jgi:hypothetical protein
MKKHQMKQSKKKVVMCSECDFCDHISADQTPEEIMFRDFYRCGRLTPSQSCKDMRATNANGGACGSHGKLFKFRGYTLLKEKFK